MRKFWEAVEQLVWQQTYERAGSPIVEGDLETIRGALLLWEALLVDLTTPFGSPPIWNIRQHIQYVSQMDLIRLVKLLKASDELLLLNCREDNPMTYDDFKHHLSAECAESGKILFPLRGIVDSWGATASEESFRSLHIAFSFMSHISLKNVDDLRETALQDYLATEEALESVVPTPEEAEIVTRWFPRRGVMSHHPLYTDVVQRHGPGSVADTKPDLTHKYRQLGKDCLTDYLDARMTPPPSTPRPRTKGINRCSKLIFVPKSAVKLRTICMEPATLMWYQEGFGDQLASYIDDHAYLRRRISLRHPEYNSELAFEGSIDGSFSTIDLSSASDCVSWVLVKSWFRRSALRELIWCTRSKNVQLPTGECIKLRKYAPMGSALCFPIECIIFAAITEASIKEVGGDPRTSRYRVYGDDIVVETKYAATVMSRLARNGFIPNRDKTFSYTSSLIFRESCGGEFLNGCDVQPIRLSRKFEGLGVDVQNAASIERLIALANDLYSHSPSGRLLIIKRLRSLPRDLQVHFSASGLTGLFSPTPTNFHIEAKGYHHSENPRRVSFDEVVYYAGAPETVTPRIDPRDEDIRLFEYLRINRNRESLQRPEDSCVVRLVPPRTARWVSRIHFDLQP